jgi:acyl-CoA thioester hydrolase
VSDFVAEKRDSYNLWRSMQLRFNDADSLGHINNAVFATLFEGGRLDYLYRDNRWLERPGTTFVLKTLSIDFVREMYFPGTVDIGTTITRIGSSSVTMHQAAFVGDSCYATSHSTIVLIDDATRKSTPIDQETRAKFEQQPLSVTTKRR